MTTLCANHGQQLVAVFLLTALAFGGCVQPQLQQGTTHSFQIQHAHNEPTPYPAAGYRPKIPFHLPRQPKVLFPATTTTSMPTLMAPTEEIDINIETLDQTTNIVMSDPHIPANNYGTPFENNNNNKNNNNNSDDIYNYMNVNVKVDLSETEVINAPTEHFQPPIPNAAKNFNTAELNNTLDFVENNVNIAVDADVGVSVEDDVGMNVDVDLDLVDDVRQVLVADVPAITDESVFSIEPQPKLNVFNRRFEFEHRQIPASTYGVPNPDVGSNANSGTRDSGNGNGNGNGNDSGSGSGSANEIPFELEFNESENELAKIFMPNSNSVHLSASNEALNSLSALKTGRLILLPTDNVDILRQIYLANFANIKREH